MITKSDSGIMSKPFFFNRPRILHSWSCAQCIGIKVDLVQLSYSLQ